MATIQFRDKESTENPRPTLKCPNCREDYNYKCWEKFNIHFKRTRPLKAAEIKQIFLLATLLFFQIVILISQAKEENLSINEMMRFSNLIHIFTVIIILCAGLYNLLELLFKESKVEVHNKNREKKKIE